MSTKCPYCGKNPVPHRIFWYNESLNILLTGLRQKVLYNSLTFYFNQKSLDATLAKYFLKIGESLKIITRQNNLLLCKVRRAQVLWEEAEKRGIKMSELLMFGRPFDCYVAEKTQNTNHKSQIIFSGLPRPKGYFNNYLDLMDDKGWFKKKMMESNMPVALGGSCTSFGEAEEVYRQIQGERFEAQGESEGQDLASNISHLVPLIVKPRSGSRGRHSITFIYTLEELKTAFKIAKKLCHWVMVEEQLFGPVYRATVINFELVGVLRGDAPEVIGDGVHNIKQLVEIKNDLLHPGVKDIIIDSLAEVFLLRQKLSVNSVPKNGEKAYISEKIGVSYGGSSKEEFELCHPENKEIFVKAARVLGDPIVGFDFMIPDITTKMRFFRGKYLTFYQPSP
jgi:hypothetical protein